MHFDLQCWSLHPWLPTQITSPVVASRAPYANYGDGGTMVMSEPTWGSPSKIPCRPQEECEVIGPTMLLELEDDSDQAPWDGRRSSSPWLEGIVARLSAQRCTWVLNPGVTHAGCKLALSTPRPELGLIDYMHTYIHTYHIISYHIISYHIISYHIMMMRIFYTYIFIMMMYMFPLSTTFDNILHRDIFIIYIYICIYFIALILATIFTTSGHHWTFHLSPFTSPTRMMSCAMLAVTQTNRTSSDLMISGDRKEMMKKPVVPHKAVAEVSQIGHGKGEVSFCDAWMAERIHSWTETWLELCLLECLQWLRWM